MFQPRSDRHVETAATMPIVLGQARVMTTCRVLPLSIPERSALLSIAENQHERGGDTGLSRRRQTAPQTERLRSFRHQRRDGSERAAELLVTVEGRRKLLHLIAPDAPDLAPEPAAPAGKILPQHPVADHREGIGGDMAGAGAGVDQDQALRPQFHRQPSRQSCRNSCPSPQPDPAALAPARPASRHWPARPPRSPKWRRSPRRSRYRRGCRGAARHGCPFPAASSAARWRETAATCPPPRAPSRRRDRRSARSRWEPWPPAVRRE